jgi:hypothetical protein
MLAAAGLCGMTTLLPAPGEVETETHQLYMHLLNLKRADGEPATDRGLLHREIAKSPECLSTLLDVTDLEGYCSGDRAIPVEKLEGLRDVLDRAHRQSVDPKFNWKPRWLNSPQDARHAHPSIPSHALHHRPLAAQS